MNKKLLFAAMSLAALTACNSDEFESQKVAQESSPVQFEVINFNEATTRAAMSGNKIVWNANDGDLFTLYHGGTVGDASAAGYQNAIYKAEASESATATLTTPSMILAGGAVMVWPVDTTFKTTSSDVPKLRIPEVLPADVENYIPYVSDEITIDAYAGNEAKAYNVAGYQRVYPVYMRPMASQLNLKTDYAGTDAVLAELYDGGSACPEDGGIDPIEVQSVELIADKGKTVLTKDIAIKFSDPDGFNTDIKAADDQWKSVKNNKWTNVTDFDKNAVTQVEKLTTKSLQGLDGCKFLILPLKATLTGAENSGIIVNTNYGKVVVAAPGYTGTHYTAAEIADAWYRFVSSTAVLDPAEVKAATAEADGKFKTTANIAVGLKQTLNGFSTYTATSGVVKSEPIGAAATRYVKVLLKYLEIDGTHVKTNKQLRDIALIWKYLGIGAGGTTTVLLDGDKDGNFEISQKTIKLINDLNAEAAKEETPRSFAVMPCQLGDNPGEPKEKCTSIVITGASDIQKIQPLTFIDDNATKQAAVVLKAGETWKWEGTGKNKQILFGDGVSSIINKGTLVNDAAATLATYDKTATQNNIPFRNEGTWTISGGDLNVQLNVTNVGTVEIAVGAEYHQDGTTTFINDAETLPQRFLAKGKEKIGLVNNHGVFAGVNGGHIINLGLIEHLEKAAKTYVYQNTNGGTGFNAAFAPANKIGRINLPFSNKDEENVTVSDAAAVGFVSVTVKEGEGAAKSLDLSSVGDFVNYCIIKSGVETISKVAAKIKYVEFDAGTTEIMWTPATAKYDGLIVFSPVNVKRGTTVNVANSVYLKAKMYVGGTTDINASKCNGYFGNTSSNFAKMYLTY